MTEKLTYTWLFSDVFWGLGLPSESEKNSSLGKAKYPGRNMLTSKSLCKQFYSKYISWDYQLFTVGFIHKISQVVFAEANWLLQNAAKD